MGCASRWLGVLALTLLAGCAPSVTGALVDAPVSVVIPRGAYAAVLAGSETTPLPSELRVAVGQVVTVRNEDQAAHYFAGEPVLPGETISKTFTQAGTFYYLDGMSCSLLEHSGMVVIVEVAGQGGTAPSPPGHGH